MTLECGFLPVSLAICVFACVGCSPSYAPATVDGGGGNGDDASFASDASSCDVSSCPNSANGQATCNAGQCSLTCDAGYHPCGDACADNTSPSTCGASCSIPCPGATHATGTCDGTACGIACESNAYGNCDSNDSNGCETELLTDPLNCGHCGSACQQNVASEQSATCSGGTCSYVCAAGHHDCNFSGAPDIDGCECNTTGGIDLAGTGCCSSVCPNRHFNGYGALWFYDCVSYGSYTAQLAMDACTAFTGTSSECMNENCATPTTDLMVCSYGSTTKCICWTYQGPDKGVALAEIAGASNCHCPTVGGAGVVTWE